MLLRETNPVTQFVSSNQTTDSSKTEGLIMAGKIFPGQRQEIQMQSKKIRETKSCHVTKPFLLITQMAANMLQNILEGMLPL